MDLKKLAAEVAKMTPEERAALAVIFGAKAEDAPSELPEDAIAEVVGDLKHVYPRFDDRRLRELAIQQLTRKRERRDPKPPRAEPVFFFQQQGLFHTDQIEADKDDPNRIKKTGYFLPPRVIAVDAKTASRLYWKKGGARQHGYIGQSSGMKWAEARGAGMSIKEAQAVEYEYMLTVPEAQRMVPPMQREKTFLAGRNIASISRGLEIPWDQGLKQGKTI